MPTSVWEPEGCSEVQRSQAGSLQSHTLSKPLFFTTAVFCSTKFGFDKSSFNAKFSAVP